MQHSSRFEKLYNQSRIASKGIFEKFQVPSQCFRQKWLHWPKYAMLGYARGHP